MTEVQKAWKGMQTRCSDNKRSGSKIVWPTIREFTPWFEANYVKGWELDKDLLVPGNTEYGPDTCRFIPSALNAMQAYNIMSIKSASLHYGGYRARVRWKGKQITIGKYDTEQEAVYWMRRRKIQWVFESLPEFRVMGVCEDLLSSVEQQMRKYAKEIGRAR